MVIEKYVNAVADGALQLKTSKLKSDTDFCIWSKQASAIAFEVLQITLQLSPLGKARQCRLAIDVGETGHATITGKGRS